MPKHNKKNSRSSNYERLAVSGRKRPSVRQEAEEPADNGRDIYSSTEKQQKAQGHAAPKTKKKRSKKQVVGRIILSCLLIGVITCCLVVSVFSIYVLAFVDSSFDFDLNNLKLAYTSVVYARDSEDSDYYKLAQVHGTENRIWVDYTDFSPYLADAIIAIEDKRFYDHEGVDWKRTISAFVNMFVDLYGDTQGGSTITQQLVKNLTGDDERTPVRKIQEIMRAREVESKYPKSTIIECYINTVHFGKGCDGIQVAAQYYFGKNAKDLTLLECASLAATIQTPNSKNPVSGPEANKERREICLKEMLKQGSITQEEYDKAMSEELVLATTGEKDAEGNKTSHINSYFVDAVIENVIEDLMAQEGYTYTYAENMVITGGLQIYSTYNAKVQQALDETYADSKNFLKIGKGEVQPQSAMCVMDYKGHIVGLMGGRGEKTVNRGLNRATQSKRQPGSSMKPLGAYSPSLEFNTITYSSFVLDAPITLADGKKYPKNSYSNSNMYVHKALERSVNTVAVRLVNNLSPQKSFDFVTKRYGISTLVESEKTKDGGVISDVTLSSMALGGTTHGVKVSEMCAAYACFGNLGKYWKPTTYTIIKDTFGKTVLEQQEKASTAIGEDTANIMNEMMQKVISGSQGTARGYSIGDWPLFGKTGTTDDNFDRWFVGGSPYYVAASWYGFDEPKAMNGMSTNPALKVWHAAMKKILADLPLKDFPESDLVTYRYYCTSTGKLATTNCSNKALGWFKTSYLPLCEHGSTILPEVTKPKPVGYKEETSSSSSKPSGSTSSAVASSKQTAASSQVVSSKAASSQAPSKPISSQSVSSSKPSSSAVSSKPSGSSQASSSKPAINVSSGAEDEE